MNQVAIAIALDRNANELATLQQLHASARRRGLCRRADRRQIVVAQDLRELAGDNLAMGSKLDPFLGARGLPRWRIRVLTCQSKFVCSGRQ